MNDNMDLSDTIKPKSDQLNADDLLTGPMTVTISGVRRGSADQPVMLDINGHQPFKPCKTMRRVLITAWGTDGKAWIGKSMTLFCDPNVKFGGVALGGIRISHLSNIDGPMNMMLTASRGRKSQVVVHPIVIADNSKAIQAYMDASDDNKLALWESMTPSEKSATTEAFEKINQNRG